MSLDVASNTLSSRQVTQYQEQGYVSVKGLLGGDDINRLDHAIMGAYRGHRYATPDDPSMRYPDPCKYTLCGNIIEEPDLAFIVEHPGIVSSVEQLLGQKAVLSQYVAYLRPPGSQGTGGDYRGGHGTAHYDYKPYRPVGSSLNWLFVAIPLVDFDDQRGPLSVCPGSHKLTRVLDRQGRVHPVQEADPTKLAPLVDGKLRRGDVLFMHMFEWHEAKGNRSNGDRYGVYNKYVACNAPPASGPFLYSDKARRALSDQGKRLLEYSSSKPVSTARLVLEHDGRILLLRRGDHWGLPGGAASDEHLIPLWDTGNVIASLEEHIKASLGIEVPWMTYIGDYEESDALSRVYAHQLEEAPSQQLEGGAAKWFDADEIESAAAAGGVEAPAVRNWMDASVLRGIGMSQARTKRNS